MIKNIFSRHKKNKERISEEDAIKLERIRLRIKMLIDSDIISNDIQQTIYELIEDEKSITNRYRDIRDQIILTKHDIKRINKMHIKRSKILDIINSENYYGDELLNELQNISRSEFNIISNLPRV